MSNSRTKFYRDTYNGKIMGVCAGISDYTGFDITLTRVAVVFLTFMTSGSTIPLYFLMAFLAEKKPIGLYTDDSEKRFWQGVRQSPERTARDVRGRLREVDRRLADVELYYTSKNKQLADEIDSLR